MSGVSDSTLHAMTAQVTAIPEVSAAVAVVRHEVVHKPTRHSPGPGVPRADFANAAEAPDAGGPPAEAYGGNLILDHEDPVTLQAALRAAAETEPDQGILYVKGDGSECVQRYQDLLRDAQRLLGGLRAAGVEPGDAVLFQFGDNRNFITAFWACVLGGYLPTPVGVAPRYDEDNAVTRKLRKAWDLLDRPLILTDRDMLTAVRSLAGLWAVHGLRAEAVETLQTGAQDTDWYPATPEDPALHLLTSGSTGTPKCVQHNHQSIVARTKATALANGFTADEVALNWMPLDHVGGLVMWHVRDVILRCHQIIAETNAFLADPLSWLDWADKYRVTNTWAPNFAFALVNNLVRQTPGRAWDLSSLRYICNGGEAVVPKTAHQFLRLLRPHRLPADAMRPSWGMSETGSGITFSVLSAEDERLGTIRVHQRSLGGRLRVVPDEEREGVTFTEVGPPAPGVRLRIVDADDSVRPERHVGACRCPGPRS